jgi:hypothetical protein
MTDRGRCAISRRGVIKAGVVRTAAAVLPTDFAIAQAKLDCPSGSIPFSPTQNVVQNINLRKATRDQNTGPGIAVENLADPGTG